jgi:hypothetical protein
MCDWAAITIPEDNSKEELERNFFAWAQGDTKNEFSLLLEDLRTFCVILLEIHSKNPSLLPRLQIGARRGELGLFVRVRKDVRTRGYYSLDKVEGCKGNPDSLVQMISMNTVGDFLTIPADGPGPNFLSP